MEWKLTSHNESVGLVIDKQLKFHCFDVIRQGIFSGWRGSSNFILPRIFRDL